MAFVAGRRTKVYFGQYDLTAYLGNASVNRSRETLDVTTFGDSDREYIGGLLSGTVTLSGFIDNASGASEPVIAAALTTSTEVPFSIFWDSDAIGSPGIAGEVWQASYENSSAVDGVQAIAANLSFTQQVDRSVSLHALGTETAIGNYTAFNYVTPATTSNGYVANLHVTAAGATGTGTVRIEDSADGSSWLPLSGATFSNFTTATSQTIIGTGTVRQYVRAALTSARNTQTFAVSFGRRP